MQTASITRRTLLGAGAALGAAALCGAAGTTAFANEPVLGTSLGGETTLDFLVKPEPITEFADVKTYDVVVVGAGASGVSAALAAHEAGASVAVLQKTPFPSSAGNFCSAPLVNSSDAAGIEALISGHITANGSEAKRDIVGLWLRNGGEAVTWLIDRATQAGAQVMNVGNAAQTPQVLGVNGYTTNFVTAFFGPKPYTFSDGITAVATYAEQQGVSFFFSTPAVQLVTNEAGAVTTVIGQTEDGGYVRFDANKGVILACGDFQNNEAMSNFFLPSAKNFARKLTGRTGDGHIMGYWAGAALMPVYSKMVHDMDAGPITIMDQGFLLNVNRSGERFAAETEVMYLQNSYLEDAQNAGHYAQIFDANYQDYAEQYPGMPTPEALLPYMPEEEVDPRPGVLEPFIGTYKADTIEELAEKIGVDPAALVATVERYNELVDKGADDDFGKPAEHLKPIRTAPFYAINRWVRLSAIDGGLLVDTNLQCLNANGEPIEGLFAAGNLTAGFTGGNNWLTSTGIGGSSLGRAVTFGYLAGKHVAQL